MIEWTEGQRRELGETEPVAIDPQPRQVYVLELLYDDSPWTDEEMDLLAEEAGGLLDEYRLGKGAVGT